MVLRQKVWVDSSVQGVLIGRIVLYWISALLYVGLGTACFQYYQHPEWTLANHAEALFMQFWPWLPSVFLCLPLVIFDIVRLSNLFVGPIYRLRQHLAELNDDPNCRALKFRDDDYWKDLAEPIHGLQAEILTLRAEVAKLRLMANSQAASAPASNKPATTAEQVAQLVTAIDLSQVNLQQVKSMLPGIGAPLGQPTA